MSKTYFKWVWEFPNHVIIRKEGCYYSARNESAEVLHDLLEYNLGSQGSNTVITGSPVLEPIVDALNEAKINYLIIEDNVVCEKKEFSNSNFCVDNRNYMHEESRCCTSKEVFSDYHRLIEIADSLLAGFDPITGEIFSDKHIVNDSDFQKLLGIAKKAIIDREKRKSNKPELTGSKWSEDEDTKLREEYKSGLTITEMAHLHNRTAFAINSRLLKILPVPDKK